MIIALPWDLLVTTKKTICERAAVNTLEIRACIYRYTCAELETHAGRLNSKSCDVGIAAAATHDQNTRSRAWLSELDISDQKLVHSQSFQRSIHFTRYTSEELTECRQDV